MRWARHVAHFGRGEAYTRFFWVGNPRGGDYLGDPDIDRRIILR
jgi:hypothetical protein